ncbi:MAG: hypothetical protein WC710_13630 [Gallionella sp.]|jgi:hypothetical protein
MSKTITGSFVAVYTTAEEYAVDAANLASFEADQNNPPVTNKTLDEANLTISYTVSV